MCSLKPAQCKGMPTMLTITAWSQPGEAAAGFEINTGLSKMATKQCY